MNLTKRLHQSEKSIILLRNIRLVCMDYCKPIDQPFIWQAFNELIGKLIYYVENKEHAKYIDILNELQLILYHSFISHDISTELAEIEQLSKELNPDPL